MGQRNLLLEQIRRIALRAGGDRSTDGQLLERFIAVRDETAFEALLRRHGPMVLGVCRRILGNPHDADDAFQAVFLVLVRKATTIRPRDAVGNWLYGVAFRTALEARGRIARRRVREKLLDNLPHPAVEWQDRCAELRPLLDRELHRLPEKYRLPVVLCDLEGRNRKEVARQLGIPEGTLSSRLATARQKLAGRLARYGFTVSAISLISLLAVDAASASVSVPLFSSTVKAALVVAAGHTAAAGIVPTAAASLMEGVLKAMFLAKIKTATVVLCGAAALGLGTGGLVYQTRAGTSDSQIIGSEQGQQSSQLPSELKKARGEMEKLRAEAEAQRRQAEEARRRAEEAMREAKRLEQQVRKGEIAARQATAQERKSGLIMLRSVQDGKVVVRLAKPGQEGQQSDLQRTLDQMKMEQTRMLSQFEAQQKRLREQLKKLDEERKLMLAKFAERRAKLQSEFVRAKSAKDMAVQQGRIAPPAGGDKLDRILERLERLEKRLDRLERRQE